MKRNRGFTLIETIIYIGLFSIIIGGLFLGAFQLASNTYTLEEDVVLEEEINFVIKKIDWLLNDMADVVSAASGELVVLSVSNGETTIRKNGEVVEICLNNSSCLEEDFIPLTSINVKAESLEFTHIPADGSFPEGVEAGFQLNDRAVSIKKYVKPSI